MISGKRFWNPRFLTNNLLRKSPTSPVADGPPIFINTIAVGPCEPTESWVTGGATVAIARTATFLWRKQTFPGDVATAFPSRRDKSEVRDVMLIQSLPEKMAWRGLFRQTQLIRIVNPITFLRIRPRTNVHTYSECSLACLEISPDLVSHVRDSRLKARPANLLLSTLDLCLRHFVAYPSQIDTSCRKIIAGN